MTITEITALPIGTKVFKVSKNGIIPYTTLGLHPTIKTTFYLIDGGTVSLAIGYHLPTNKDFFTDNYEDAKNKYWEISLTEIRLVNETYFEGKKNITEEFKTQQENDKN